LKKVIRDFKEIEMIVHIGTDYQGYEMARAVQAWLTELGNEVVWHGAEEFDEGDDFPLFSIRVSKAVVDSEDLGADCKGLIFGAVGAGEVITANKVSGARAVAGVSEHFIRYSREHGNTNVLVIGAQLQSLDEAKKLIQVFFETDYSTVIDDTRRILHATEYENSGTIEGWLIER